MRRQKHSVLLERVRVGRVAPRIHLDARVRRRRRKVKARDGTVTVRECVCVWGVVGVESGEKLRAEPEVRKFITVSTSEINGKKRAQNSTQKQTCTEKWDEKSKPQKQKMPCGQCAAAAGVPMQNGRDPLRVCAHAGDVGRGREGAEQEATGRGKARELRVEVEEIDAPARVLADRHLREMQTNSFCWRTFERAEMFAYSVDEQGGCKRLSLSRNALKYDSKKVC